MNKEFVRPLILIIVTIIIIGIIASIIPACDKGSVPIKKMHWFDSLSQIGKPGVKAAELATRDTVRFVSDLSPLEQFRKELNGYQKHPKGSIRIAYYGDSIIEGDLITGKLRHSLQTTYGGSGIGFMPITSIVSGFRHTIKHSFSKNWEAVSFMTSGKPNLGLGVSGFVFIPRNYYVVEKSIEPTLDTLGVDTTAVVTESKPKKSNKKYYVNTSSWVKYEASNIPGGCAQFERIRLFYSNASDSSYVNCSLDGQTAQRYNLRSGTGLQVLDLSGSNPVKTVYLEFNPLDPIHVYGVSLDQNSGLFVDSFTIRGYSGMYFGRIPQAILSGFQQALDYDLVILHYGENVSNPKIRDYGFYKRGMMKTIAHIRSAMPGVPILLISAHDRSLKIDGEYQTSPDIPSLINAQAETAREADCGFWNLFEVMGGLNSMITYVKHSPPWASPDYTHFNRTGADHIGSLLYKVITAK